MLFPWFLTLIVVYRSHLFFSDEELSTIIRDISCELFEPDYIYL